MEPNATVPGEIWSTVAFTMPWVVGPYRFTFADGSYPHGMSRNTRAFDVRTANLAAINSITKYPSIPTYHTLGDRGRITEPVVPFYGMVIGTEKIDGTNVRIVLLPDGTYLIGSRERLIYARGDLIEDPTMGIITAVKPYAESAIDVFSGIVAGQNRIMTIYGEVYGGKVGSSAKEYGITTGFRVFDIMLTEDRLAEMLTWSPSRISGWREDHEQPFYTEGALESAAIAGGFKLTPRLFILSEERLPTDIGQTAAWITSVLPHTMASLHPQSHGRAEGIVLRTRDRRIIAKARVEDYTRALRARRP